MSAFTEIEPQNRAVESMPQFLGLGFQGILFIAFLFVVLVGISPFNARDTVKIAQISQSSGDAGRQVVLIVLAMVLALRMVITRGIFSFFAMPWPFYLVFAWFFLSISWSIAPDVSFRRCMLTTVVCLSVFAFAEDIGPERMMKLLTGFLSVLLLVNFASVFLVRQAVHLPGEMATDLIGNWRGLHFHKNIAGPVAGLSALLFLVRAIRLQTFASWLLVLLCLCFVYFTRSKTALYIDLLLLPITAIAEICSRKPENLRKFVRASFIGIGLILIGVVLKLGDINSMIGDPDSFTGRGAIWSVVSNYAAKYPVTGSGFSAFWGLGDASPVLAATSLTWLYYVAHSHNGFLEILVTTGIPGLLMSTFAVVIWPVWRLLKLTPSDFASLFGVLAFSTLLNLSETRIFQGTREEWIIHLIVIAVIWQSTKRKPIMLHDASSSSADHYNAQANLPTRLI